MNILLIDNDLKLNDYLRTKLEHEGYTVSVAQDGQQGLKIGLENNVDLILMDLDLPLLSGMEVLRRLREQKSIPIVILTPRNSVMDKVVALDAGANDYVTKPYHIEELLARIRVLTRNIGRINRELLLKNAGIVLDRKKRLVFNHGQSVPLTKMQFDLLECFMMNQDIVLSREQLLSLVWGYDYSGESNVVDVYVRYIRNRLGISSKGGIIQSVRGVGYVMRSL